MFKDICKKLEIPPFTGKILCAALLGIVIILVAVFLHKKYVGREGFLSDTKKNFVFCSMKGCPHCEAADEPWNKMVKSYSDNKYINVSTLDSQKDAAFMEEHGVVGYPSFLVIDKDGNKETEYHGDRTEGGFVRFVKKLLCKAGSSADC